MANFLPVLLLSAAVMGLALFPSDLANQFGGTTTLSFHYGAGGSPITSMVFHLPPEVASAVVIDSATNSFKTELRGNNLTLSGGSLSPGQDNLTVRGHILRYIPAGTYQFTATGTTSSGSTVESQGQIGVSEDATALLVLGYFMGYQVPLFSLGALGVAGSAAAMLYSRSIARRRALRQSETVSAPEAAPEAPPAPRTPSATATRAGPPAGGAAAAAALVSPPDAVILGVSAPKSARPGDEFTARFVAYVRSLEGQVREVLTSLSPRSTSHLGLHTCSWQPGTRVKVRLEGSHLNIPTPEQEFTWAGNCSMVDFDVTVPADAPEYVTVLKFDVMIDEILVAKLRLDLSIGPPSGEVATASVEPAHTAFASYASADRKRVLDRVAAVSISAGLDIFMDCLSLHPSEEWKPRLTDEIRKRELFLLFWSSQAKNSQWVSWEWHTALEEKGISAMQIQPLQTVLEAPPPEELKELHFGDPYMLARRAYDGLPSPQDKENPRASNP